MATIYRCSKCGRTVTVGVPVHALTQEVSALLSRELARPITYHDWNPAATDRSLRERAEKIWEEKCEAYFRSSGSLRTLPETCPQCGATHSWEITLGAAK
ncbi:MAG: hypothetical protein HY689_10625 [Chloroflexi bacterium]|nr:hypothetical protein [Chloroflexota bacterium]